MMRFQHLLWQGFGGRAPRVRMTRASAVLWWLPCAMGGTTSSYVRPRPSRSLLVEGIDGCALTFRTLQAPRDDYFRGAACSSQVHVTLGSSESAVVSFASSTADVESEVWFWRANDTRGARRTYWQRSFALPSRACRFEERAPEGDDPSEADRKTTGGI